MKILCKILFLILITIPMVSCGNSIPFKEKQVWKGYYVCSQGETNLNLIIKEVVDNNIIAVFDFNYKDGQKLGKFYVRGQYNIENRILKLWPGEWIFNPNNFTAVGMEGYVTPDGKKYSGNITLSSCREFVLTLD